MKKPHLMQTPDDLDVSSEEQSKLSEMISGDEEKRERFVILMFQQQVAHDVRLTEAGSAMGLRYWQRAAHEAHQKAKSDPGLVNQNIAKALWLMVRYCQESISMAFEAAADPSINEALDHMGIPRPEVEQ